MSKRLSFANDPLKQIGSKMQRLDTDQAKVVAAKNNVKQNNNDDAASFDAVNEDNKSDSSLSEPQSDLERKENQRLNARQRGMQCQLDDLANLVLSTNLSTVVRRKWCRVIKETLITNHQIKLATIEERRKMFISKLPQIQDCKELLHQVQQFDEPWQVCQVVMSGLTVYERATSAEQTETANSFVQLIVQGSLSQHKGISKWYQLAKEDRQNFVKMVERSTIRLQPVALKRFMSVFRSELLDLDLDQQLTWIKRYTQEQQVDLIAVLQKLPIACAQIVSAKLDDYWSSDILRTLRTAKNIDFERNGAFLAALTGIGKSTTRLHQVQEWFSLRWLTQLIKNLSSGALEINYDHIEHELRRLIDCYNDASTTKQDQLKHGLKSVKTIDDLARLATAFSHENDRRQSSEGYKHICAQMATQLSNAAFTIADVQEESKANYFTEVIESFKAATGYTLYDWQEIIVAAGVAACRDKSRPCLMNIPTGMGKSLITTVLAMMIVTCMEHRVLLVSQNKHAKVTMMKRYAIEGKHDTYPGCRIRRLKIWCISIDELLVIEQQEKLDDFIVIVDEFDLLSGMLVQFKASTRPDTYKPVCIRQVLSKFALLIGLSGSLSDGPRFALTDHPKLSDPLLLNIAPRELSNKNRVTKQILAESQDGIIVAAAKYAQSLTDMKLPALIVDQQLSMHLAAFKKLLPSYTFYLQGWSNADAYDDLERQLTLIHDADYPLVITDEEGARGVDFQFAKRCEVIIVAEKLSLSFLKQCLGRGSRKADRLATGTIIVPSAKFYPNLFDLEENLIQAEKATVLDRQVKNRIISKVAAKVLLMDADVAAFVETLLNDDTHVAFSSRAEVTAVETWKKLQAALSQKVKLPDEPLKMLMS